MSRPINFTDTTVTKKPYVEIDGIEYEVQDGTYQGGTDLNANTFNKMQDELDMFRNMLNIPDGTYTHSGVTYIVKDGIFTYSSGTPTSDVHIGINITPFTLKAGTYTMSNNSGHYPYIMLYNGDTKVVESEYANNGVKTFTIENETTIDNVHLYFGQSTPPASVKPQVEEGTRKSNFTSWAGYIVESGSNDNGSYIKYSDGTMICYKSTSEITINITTAWGSLYEGSLNVGNFPVEFVETPTISVTPFGSGMLIEQGGANASKTSWGTITVVRPTSVSGVKTKFHLIAIGRWK